MCREFFVPAGRPNFRMTGIGTGALACDKYDNGQIMLPLMRMEIDMTCYFMITDVTTLIGRI
jgi:hypothetical protein